MIEARFAQNTATMLHSKKKNSSERQIGEIHANRQTRPTASVSNLLVP